MPGGMILLRSANNCSVQIKLNLQKIFLKFPKSIFFMFWIAAKNTEFIRRKSYDQFASFSCDIYSFVWC